ncbi:hypothetical protein NE237_025215 [Protea cynaroides]|uniref:Uncharacterized protein n=1 Tax=Protea cynaroides TaxID=273540 RepID=A0A9Q0H6M8_9MAGN|nr:hypothetical protein NE237_025215 [Protea cynaroides]
MLRLRPRMIWLRGDTLGQHVTHVQGAWADVSDDDDSPFDYGIDLEKDGDDRSRMNDQVLPVVEGLVTREMTNGTSVTNIVVSESITDAPLVRTMMMVDPNATVEPAQEIE